MDGFETTLQRFAAWLSHLLQPIEQGLQQLGLSLRVQMDAAGVPAGWQGPLLTCGWLLILAMVVRTLVGWWRLLAVVAAAVVLAKMYGVLPGA